MNNNRFFLLISLFFFAFDAFSQVNLDTDPKQRIFQSPSNAPFISAWDKVPDAIRNRNSFRRYEWFYRSRLDENGDFPKEHIDRQKAAELQKIQNYNIENDGPMSDQWTNIGPLAIDMASSFIPYWGNVSGRVRGMDIHPTNPNIVYIGAAAGGIWKTTDGGASWTDKSGDLNLLTFGAIAIDPSNTEIIYAGTGETRWLFNTVTFEGDGLYKSTNGGNNWTRIINGFGSQTQFSDIQVSPSNSNVILASIGTGNYNNPGVSNQGVWRSSDAGVTWTRVINLTGAFDVAFHPTDGNLAYSVIGNTEASGGFMVSTNAGVNWSQSNTGLPANTSRGRLQFEISKSNPSIMYCLVYHNEAISATRTTCAYKSTDAGASWSQISTGVNIAGSYDGTNVSDQGSYDLCLSISPTNSNNVFFGNVEISKTTDGSNISFVRNPAGYSAGAGAWDCYTHVDIHKIMYAPSDANIIYTCCDGGIYRSSNSGSTFTHLNNGVNTIQFYRIASHPTNANILYGGAQDNGNFSTTDKGATSWAFETSGDGMECFVDYSNSNNVFMSTQFGSLSKSTDAGATWNNVVGSSSGTTAWTAPYWQHPTVPSAIYAAYGRGIIRSSFNGNAGTWSFIATSITTNRLTSVAHSSVNTNNMLAVASYFTTSPRIYKSTNEGIGSWTDITSNVTGSGFSGTMIHGAVAHPTDENTFYLTRASYTTGQVLRTTNFGTNWTDISSDLPAITVSDLFVDPANTNHIYVGNDFGVYWSSNSGANWIKLTNGFPIVPVLDFSYFSNGGTRYLRAATHGRGIYELSIDVPLPVVLHSFTYSVIKRDVKLNWSTSQESNNSGFEVERKSINGSWSKIGFVNGNGTTNTERYYSYEDKNLSTGKFSYRLKQIDYNGNFEYFNLNSEIEIGIPRKFELSQNYPNPFNPTTKIDFAIPVDSRVSLIIYDITGREVTRLINNELRKADFYTVQFNAVGNTSGVFFYKLSAENFTQTRKMIMLK